MTIKDYIAAKNRISEFVLKEIDTGKFTENEIAKMLVEVSLSYLRNEN